MVDKNTDPLKPTRKARLGYTKTQYLEMMNIVERADFLQQKNSTILETLMHHFKNLPPTYTVLFNIRRKLKKRNRLEYEKLKDKNDDFIAQVIKKRTNLLLVREEMMEMYNKQGQPDSLKLKILDRIVDLDMVDLQMLQDFPYLHKYHEDIDKKYSELNEDIRTNDISLASLTNNSGSGPYGNKPEIDKGTGILKDSNTQPNNTILYKSKTGDKEITRIPIEEITKNKEIQDILSSRDQSGFTRHTKR